MTNLVIIQNDRTVTTSRMLAQSFEKQHQHVIRDVKNLECSPEFNASNFGLVEYSDQKGEKRPEYIITRDGFTFLAMGYTGARAAQFKEAYIKAFNEMEQSLRDKQANRIEIPTFSTEELIIMQARSIIELKAKVEEIRDNLKEDGFYERRNSLPEVRKQIKLQLFASNEDQDFLRVSDYCKSKGLILGAQAASLIGLASKKYSKANGLSFKLSPRGNQYTKKAINYGIDIAKNWKASKKTEVSVKKPGLVRLMQDPLTKSLKAIAVSEHKEYPASFRPRLSGIISNYLHKNTKRRFSIRKSPISNTTIIIWRTK